MKTSHLPDNHPMTALKSRALNTRQATVLSISGAFFVSMLASIASLIRIDLAGFVFMTFLFAIGSVACLAAIVLLMGAWIRQDAAQHDRSERFATRYLMATVVTCGLALVPYLMATRGGKAGLIATIYFVLLIAACWVALVSGGAAGTRLMNLFYT